MRYLFNFLFLTFFLAFIACKQKPTTNSTLDVLVIGGGTGGTAAGIAAARLNANTLIIEPSPWLGGMLTSAGISATNGNHTMPAGLWGEFREKIREHYGSKETILTERDSQTLFEPHIGAKIFSEMAKAEASLDVWYNAHFVSAQKVDGEWQVTINKNGETIALTAQILVDGTDLGDVAASVNALFEHGMDAYERTGEKFTLPAGNNMVQDFTYAAILKDYGSGINKTIPRPKDYDPALFQCACAEVCDDKIANLLPCKKMLTYTQLPNNKYLINWSNHGNDYYANLVELSKEARAEVYQKAKNRTLGFIYFIQTELGYKNLGLADDEFPTEDLLPFIPYHREGRRISNFVLFNLNDLLTPFTRIDPLYRTGIAVGDHPLDHHHAQNPLIPKINFPNIPSFNIPATCLLSMNVEDLVMADKAISVSHIVNGVTQIQSVVLQIGQAAGIMAALSAQSQKPLSQLSIRQIQQHILNGNGYLMPYADVPPQHPHFSSIQKVGATGILKGVSKPDKQANRTWFYPDSTIQMQKLMEGIAEFSGLKAGGQSGDLITTRNIQVCLYGLAQGLALTQRPFETINSIQEHVQANWTALGLESYQEERTMTRGEIAVLLDKIFNVFGLKDVAPSGIFINNAVPQ